MRFEYNRANEVVRKTDQNGTVHEYAYDNLGRLVADTVKILGNGVDGAVRKIATTFTVTGGTETVTSYGIDDNVVNQVRYTYDTNGMLKREYTAHNGAVSVSATPYIQYGYDSIANGLRQVSLKYPGGNAISYEYDNAGRPVSLTENGNDVVRYDYSGGGIAMKTQHVEPGLTLDYTGPNALDRFGRVASILERKIGAGRGGHIARLQGFW